VACVAPEDKAFGFWLAVQVWSAGVLKLSRVGSRFLGAQERCFSTSAFSVDGAAHAPPIVVRQASSTEHLDWRPQSRISFYTCRLYGR